MRIFFWLAMACATGLSGCATFVDGSDQYITLNSGSVHYSHCVLSRPGERFNVTTPGSIHIAKSSDDLRVECARPGYGDVATTIPSDVNLWTFGNLVTGGVTAVVDAWTGAMFEYPTEVDIPMSPGQTQPSAVYSSTYSPPPPPPASASEPVQTSAAPANTGTPLPGTLPDNF